jgi:hypothetical protein
MSVCSVEEVKSSSLYQSPGFPHWISHIFPKDRLLARPEDGKALPNGCLVADERYGLVLIEGDASHRPFGRFTETGYIHKPPELAGGAQPVLLSLINIFLLLEIFAWRRPTE